ncbi:MULTISPECIES: helix-turn-helix transcriptional regulator [Pseudomonas]|uniref:LexA family transcriptional regulator n=1 Tax=Pseudomonas TaxID=286 RepID=UPI000CFF7950|nr:MULTISPECIES: S24 family peptidase [Pseudomonas]PRA53196.1 propanediol utilization protein [Pseudomonas sp. MYb115]QXN52202.1 helix-turn-helix domain-containing protein [Pseudomonas fluorescens]WSO26531.1 S24 family peptidase [Pseudomonas fluorescens]
MTKKRILPPELIAECAAAHDLFLSKKNELKLSQKKIADEAGMTPAAVNLYFKGINPLNTKFAAVLARMLDEPVSAFSPRLADEIASLTSAPVKGGASAAEKVMEMIRKHAGKNLDADAQEKIAAAALTAASEAQGKVIQADFSGLKARAGEIVIRQYDVRASMGHGQVPGDYNEVVRNLIIHEDVLREKNISYTSPHSLAMITGWGQSMEGTINDKDPLIVDKGVNEFAGDGIYVLTWLDHLYIKRVQVMDSERFWLISDNAKHKDQVARIEDVTIHAKVLMIWNARKA